MVFSVSRRRRRRSLRFHKGINGHRRSFEMDNVLNRSLLCIIIMTRTLYSLTKCKWQEEITLRKTCFYRRTIRPSKGTRGTLAYCSLIIIIYDLRYIKKLSFCKGELAAIRSDSDLSIRRNTLLHRHSI